MAALLGIAKNVRAPCDVFWGPVSKPTFHGMGTTRLEANSRHPNCGGHAISKAAIFEIPLTSETLHPTQTAAVHVQDESTCHHILLDFCKPSRLTLRGTLSPPMQSQTHPSHCAQLNPTIPLGPQLHLHTPQRKTKNTRIGRPMQ